MTMHLDSVDEIPQAGVHSVRSRRSSRSLCRSLEAHGARCFLLDLNGASDKLGLLRATAGAIGAPPSAGRNWDALEEAIRDLEWAPAPRYAVIVTGGRTFAAADPATWATLEAVLESAVAHWASLGVPLAVLIRGLRA